jgi:hypothetical protein
MASFKDLRTDTYYLILTDGGSPIELVSVVLETRTAVLLRSYLPSTKDFFRLKEEVIPKVIEELDQEKALQFEQIYLETGETVGEELFEYEEEDEE